MSCLCILQIFQHIITIISHIIHIFLHIVHIFGTSIHIVLHIVLQSVCISFHLLHSFFGILHAFRLFICILSESIYSLQLTWGNAHLTPMLCSPNQKGRIKTNVTLQVVVGSCTYFCEYFTHCIKMSFITPEPCPSIFMWYSMYRSFSNLQKWSRIFLTTFSGDISNIFGNILTLSLRQFCDWRSKCRYFSDGISYKMFYSKMKLKISLKRIYISNIWYMIFAHLRATAATWFAAPGVRGASWHC